MADTEVHLSVAENAIIVMMMSFADAALTLLHISDGVAHEWNPLMHWVLYNLGMVEFLLVKMLLTGTGLIVLVHCYDKAKIARVGFWSVVIFYFCLLLYHAYILFFCY